LHYRNELAKVKNAASDQFNSLKAAHNKSEKKKIGFMIISIVCSVVVIILLLFVAYYSAQVKKQQNVRVNLEN
jgi:predicted permease